MRAIVYRDFGSPDVLEVGDVDKPVPAAGEVLVAVRAAAVNMFDWYMVRGKPRVCTIRLVANKP
jgi:NADPH:quinone reductase-like Zn-dependent oxidoreductase